jgi:DeoR/GlpR family transcriptional regulator of sugar metabolism
MTVIVNSMRFAVELGPCAAENSIVVLGGQYRPERMDTVGAITSTSLEQLRGFRAFVGADGLSPEFGVTACDIESAHLYKLAIRNAREAILMVDHTKFLAPSLFKICELDDISRIVTDRRPSNEWVAHLNDRGIDLIYPKEEGPAEVAGK